MHTIAHMYAFVVLNLHTNAHIPFRDVICVQLKAAKTVRKRAVSHAAGGLYGAARTVKCAASDQVDANGDPLLHAAQLARRRTLRERRAKHAFVVSHMGARQKRPSEIAFEPSALSQPCNYQKIFSE